MPNLRVSERKKSKFLCNLARQNKYESLLEGEYKFSRLHTKKTPLPWFVPYWEWSIVWQIISSYHNSFIWLSQSSCRFG